MWQFPLAALLFAASVSADIGPKCTYTNGNWGSGSSLVCHGDKYVLPHSMDLTDVPNLNRLAGLTIGGSKHANVILTDEFTTFPDCPLTSVTLRGFRTENQTDVPLNTIFSTYSKRYLQDLTVEGGLLTALPAHLLTNYPKLRSLTILSTGLREIDESALVISQPLDWDAWETISLSFAGNHLTQLNFSVFTPTADKLNSLYLRSNGIQNLTAASGDHFSRLQTLDLSDNDLSFLPREVTWSLPLLRSLDLSGNSFCPTDKFCRCCELYDMMEWLSMYGVSASFSCGTDNPANPCITGHTFSSDFVTGECRRHYELGGAPIHLDQWSSCRPSEPFPVNPEYPTDPWTGK